MIRNIDISSPLYERAWQIGFFPENHTLKATISAMWALDVLKLMLRFPATLRFFNNPATSFLQSDILPYAALDAYYLLLLFLGFGPYGLVPEVYNAPALFPHNSLDAAEMDHLAETSSHHGRSFCLGMVPKGFRNIKILTGTTHPNLLTAPKVPKKKKKKQKDEWNKSADVSDDEDPALQPPSLFDDPKCLQAAITSAMKSRLTDGLIEIDINKSNYMANPHSHFYFYSNLLNIIDFQNRFWFPALVYAYPLPTTASITNGKLAAALTAYHFPSPLPRMLFPEHYWMDYPDALKEEIQRILLLQLTTFPVPQIAQPAPTSGTPQPKVTTTKTAVPAKHTPPAGQSDIHCSSHESHFRDDRHCKEPKQSPQKDTTSRDSHQQKRSDDAPPNCTQSEQTCQVHSTGFYEEAYKHSFHQSPLKLTDYISSLHWDTEIQKRMEGLKNLPKPVFKVPLPLPTAPMDVEPDTSSSTALLPTAMSLPPMALTSAMTTTITHTTSLPPTAPMSVQTTTPAQPSFVIMTGLVLGTAPPAVASLWDEELSVVDAIHTAHLALFLYEARGLDNSSCLLQAYNMAVGLIYSWMAYPQYSTTPRNH
uniref:Uncharacterized protein n=1 Tax=Romanomermis culicivorax TaxID=13658 RepID=A0A915JJQ2_ROMCU